MKSNRIFAPLFLTALVLLFTSCGGGKYAHSTPEEFGESLVNIIKSGDKAGLKELTPTKNDIVETINGSDIPEEKKQEVLAEFESEWPEMEKEMQRDVFERFDEMQAEIKEEGKDLSKIKYTSTETGEERVREGLTMRDITAHFEYDGEDVEVKIRKAAKMKRGWVMSPDGFRIR